MLDRVITRLIESPSLDKLLKLSNAITYLETTGYEMEDYKSLYKELKSEYSNLYQ